MARTTTQGLFDYRRKVTEQKRGSVLAAAREVFLEVGFGKAAVSAIARKADVSTATLYKYFESKECLFEEVIRDTYATADESMACDVDGNAAEAMHAFLKELIRRHSSREINNLLRIAWAEVPHSAELARDIFEIQSKVRHDDLRGLLDMLIERGDLLPHDTDIGAMQISGMVKEQLVWPGIYRVEHEYPADADEIIMQAIETYLARFSPMTSPSVGAKIQKSGRPTGLMRSV
jgi:TetR/AcrR family transcriptional regulator of autoinduction and epiphytic fitness